VVLYAGGAQLAVRFASPAANRTETWTIDQQHPLPAAEQTGQLRVALQQPWAAPPLFFWSLTLEGRHSPTRHFALRLPPLPVRTTHLTYVLSLPRGHFATTARWELSDALGLTRWRPRACHALPVVFLPGARSLPVPRAARLPSATRGPRRFLKREGELFDVRPYQPGDDFRRVHWPLWAHSGETWVRVPDWVPPPTGRRFWLLDTSGGEQELDDRLAALSAWLTPAEDWSLWAPATSTRLRSPDDPREALAGLASLPWQAATVARASFPAQVVLVTGGATTVAKELRQHLDPRIELVVAVVHPGERQTSHRPRWWRRR